MADTPSGKRKLLVSLVLITVVIGGGTGIAAVLYAMRPKPPRRDLAPLPPVVQSIVLQPEDVSEHFVGYATAKPDRTADLAAEVIATVIERVNDLQAGDHVSKGQLLFRLDDRSYQHALAQAEALVASDRASLGELKVEAATIEKLLHSAKQELAVAAREKARLADLFEQNMAAKKEYDFAKRAYQQARRVLEEYEGRRAKIEPQREKILASLRSHEAAVAQARLDVERCALRAPFAGTMEAVYAEVGDHVAPGIVVAKLLDTTRIQLAIQLPAGVYPHVQVGALCRIEVDSMPAMKWTGTVTRIAPSVDEQTRTFSVYAEVDNTRQAVPLLPGTFVRAEVTGLRYAHRLLVPRQAIRDQGVMIVEGRVARRHPVTVERFLEDRALVSEGLHPGDRVILSPLSQLHDGSPVRLHRAVTSGPSSRAGSLPENVGSSP